MGVAYKLQTNYASESLTDQQCRQSDITAGVDTAAVRLAIIPRQGTTVDSSIWYDTIRYDTRCYFNVRSKADISQLNLPHGTDN